MKIKKGIVGYYHAFYVKSKHIQREKGCPAIFVCDMYYIIFLV